MGTFFSHPRRPAVPRSERVAVITGCDMGFGHGVALELDKMGYHVVAGCLTETGAKDLQAKISSRSQAVVYDVTKQEDQDRVARMVQQAHPDGIYDLVCNAGFLTIGPVEWEPMKDVRGVFEVNFFGLVSTVKTFLPQLHQRKGRIVVIASAAGRLAMADWASYSATKFAVNGYAEALRRELWPFGIQVVTIEPGFAKTNLIATLVDKYLFSYNTQPEHIRARYGDQFVQKRTGVFSGHIKDSSDAQVIIDTVVRACDDANPQPRQLVGFDAYAAAFLAMLPTSLADSLLRLISGGPASYPAQHCVC